MKTRISNFIKLLTAVLFLYVGTSCATSTGGANESGKIDVNNLIGSWFWNYGYDQEQFCNEQLTINTDSTMTLNSIGPNWGEWLKGEYSVIDDDEHGKSLLLHLTSAKYTLESEFEPIDVKIYYKIHTLNNDRLITYRYKRDASAMNWGISYFDPGILQDYSKIKDGTKENLIGEWIFNKKGTPNSNWKETWIFSTDGTMESFWTEDDYKSEYKGTYEVKKGADGNVLHQTLTQESADGSVFTEINPPMEFWYDYKICNENLINVNCVKNNIGGKEHVYESAIQNFYYRNIPLESVTYHWENYTFYDYYPVGSEYELLTLEKAPWFTGVHEALLFQEIIGWYDNPQFSGNPIEKISKNDSSTPHEFWAKWAIKVRKSVWDESKGKDGYGYRSPLPLSVLFKNIPDGMKIPSKGEKRIIVLSANVSKDFEGWGGIALFDASEGWQRGVGQDWHPLKSVNGKFVDLFEIELTDDLKTENLTQIGLNLGYNPDTLDDVTILTDFKFEILEPNSPRLIEHTFNYGNFIFKQKSVIGYDFYLPQNPDDLPSLTKQEQDHFWQQQGNEFIGWYDNPEFKGNPIKSISGEDNTKGKTFYGKYNLKFYQPEAREDGNYYSNRWILAKTVTPNTQIDPKKGDVVMVVVSGTLSQEYEGPMGLDLHNFSFEDSFLANDWHYVETKNKKFATCFELKMKKDANYKSIDEVSFLLAVDSLNAPVQLVLSDFKFEVIDENSSTKIIEHTFNYGNFIFKKNAVSNYDYYLPSPSTFKDISWQLYSQEFLGWYDNPDFKGNPIKVILAADNSKAKTFYGKFDIKFGAATKSDNGGFYSNSQFFVKSVIPDAKISKLNPKAGEVVKVAVSGTLSKDYVGVIGMDLHNRTFNDGFLGNEWHYVETKDKKLQTYFEVKINKDANYKSIDDAIFLLALNPESEGEELILSDYKFEFVDKDPFVTTEAESKHVSIKPCAEGFEITVRKLDSEKGDWTYAEIWAEEDGHQTVAGFDLSILNKNKSITFVWPFCEKGKTYNFRFAWTDSNGQYNNQPLSVIASNGKGELNFDALKKIKVTLESNSKEANLCVANFNKENILELVKNYQESIIYVGVQFPVISGLNNWSDTQWLFAVYCGLFPEIDSNNSFFAELFSKGKANLLGDYNFDWGSKEKINEELSKKTTFWTDLSVHFNINTSPEGVSFYTNSNKTDNVPYTPVKF